MALAPIALFVYKRPDHTRKTLEALSRNSEAKRSSLHVFCDGPKSDASEGDRRAIMDTKSIVRERQWCGEVHVHETESNLGLARSIRQGVTTVLDSHERVIVLEDDIETSPGFLAYMNQALELYASESRVMHISAYVPSTSYQSLLPTSFFHRMMFCWGWATWRRSWNNARWDALQLTKELSESPGSIYNFDVQGTFPLSEHLRANLEGRSSTWAVFWAASIYLKHGLCLFPGSALVRNIGLDGSGENSDNSGELEVSIVNNVALKLIPMRESLIGRFYMQSFFRYGNDSGIFRRMRIATGRLKHRLFLKMNRKAYANQ
jgi:hypothetical protein